MEKKRREITPVEKLPRCFLRVGFESRQTGPYTANTQFFVEINSGIALWKNCELHGESDPADSLQFSLAQRVSFRQNPGSRI